MTVNFQVGDRVVCQEYQWSDWYWLERRIVRQNVEDQKQFQECHDTNYLRDQLSKLKNLKHELISRSTSATESRKNELERNIKEMDKQIDYLRI